MGPSYVVALGDYKGGETWVEEEEGPNTHRLTDDVIVNGQTRFLTGVVWRVGALIGAWPGGCVAITIIICLWALYVGFVTPCALSRTRTKYETENRDVKKARKIQ